MIDCFPSFCYVIVFFFIWFCIVFNQVTDWYLSTNFCVINKCLCLDVTHQENKAAHNDGTEGEVGL